MTALGRTGVPRRLWWSFAISASCWIAVALAMTALSVTLGEAGIARLLGALRAGLDFWLPEFRIEPFELAQKGDQAILKAGFQLREQLVIGRRLIDEPGWVRLQLTVGSMLEPAVLATATAAAWPQRPALRVLATGLGALLGVALTMLLVPTLMSGMVLEKYYYAFAADQIRPFIIRLPRFFEGGGRPMLAIVTGLVAAGATAAAGRAIRLPALMGPNGRFALMARYRARRRANHPTRPRPASSSASRAGSGTADNGVSNSEPA